MKFDLEELTTRVVIDYLPRIERVGECWRTHRKPNPRNGYAYISLRHRPIRAHRAFFMAAHGLVLGSHQPLDHLCRNRWCVRPGHMEQVDNRTNVLRGAGITAQNAAAVKCPSGHAYTDENTRVGRGRRHCRTCELAKNRRYWASGRGAEMQRLRRSK